MADDLTEGVDPNERALESTREFESEILSVVDKIFLEMKPRFDHVGLHSKGPEIARGTNAGYWSEVRLWLWAGDEPYDAIEFFVYHEGRKVTSPREIDQWLRKELEGVIATRQSELD